MAATRPGLAIGCGRQAAGALRVLGRDGLAGAGGTAEVERRVRLLHGREEQLSPLHGQVLAFKVQAFTLVAAREDLVSDTDELG